METDCDLATLRLLPIEEVAERAGFAPTSVEPYGRHKAKIDLGALGPFEDATGRRGRLVAVTATNPTPRGEGKTVTAIALVDALSSLGKRAMGTLRQPSLGPIFGKKGGATGGGRAQIAPRDDINLHFTGDFHAVAVAQNLLAAMVDNQLYRDNPLGLDPAQIDCARAIDVEDRALRRIVTGVGLANGSIERKSAFEMVAASEVMAIVAQAAGRADLKRRLGNIAVGWARDGRIVRASELKAEGAMAALLARAVEPNLVQTLEGNPVLVHTGPFANVATGNSSVIADKMALGHADYVVTEAGFGTDSGFEKLVDVKCRGVGYRPEVAIVVVTVRALKWQGTPPDRVTPEGALRVGCANLVQHVENVRAFGCPCIVAINVFDSDTEEDLRTLEEVTKGLGVDVVRSRAYQRGGEGALDLARTVLHVLDAQHAGASPLYPLSWSLRDKIAAVATKIYGAADVELSEQANRRIDRLEAQGYGSLPICIAKTPSSLSHDPKLRNRPSGFTFPVDQVRLFAGAGFVVPIAGSVLAMPGLPEVPAAESIDVDELGRVSGI